MEEKKKISTSIRLDPDLQVRVDDKLHALKKAGQKMSFQAAFHEAFECWLALGTTHDSSSTEIPQIDLHAPQHHNALVEKLKRIEKDKLETIGRLDTLITEEAGILREIEANPRHRGRNNTPGHRKRGNG